MVIDKVIIFHFIKSLKYKRFAYVQNIFFLIISNIFYYFIFDPFIKLIVVLFKFFLVNIILYNKIISLSVSFKPIFFSLLWSILEKSLQNIKLPFIWFYRRHQQKVVKDNKP